jgi:transposase-like protein
MKTKKLDKAVEKKPTRKPSFALKKKVIDLIVNGRVSKNYASAKYGISRSTIGYWFKKITTLDEKKKFMSKNDELKKLKKRIAELEDIKDFQQDIIAEFELATGKELAKKYLPEHLAKEIEKKKKSSR